LDKAGVLRDIIIVGSWCTLFYRKFFGRTSYMVSLVTRDMDLLIPRPSAMRAKTDVAELLKDLGFVVGFTGSKGFIRLQHPQLIVEFLVPERGRGSDKPYALPHPANFALHKLLVLARRPTPEKQMKDKEAALRVLSALIDKGQGNLITDVFHTMPRKWQAMVKRQLTDAVEEPILDLLR